MSSTRKSSLDPWVRIYDITDAGRHKKGYTIYKVVSKVFPRNSVEATTEVTVWKRYSDFKRLHKVLSSLHQALHLKGKFPEFVKGRYFGRFDEEVVEERRQSALGLLQFAAQNPALYNSQFFVKFFDGGQEVSLSEEESSTPPLVQPLEPKISVPIFTESDNGTRHAEMLRIPSNCLEGTWQHRRSAENISLSSDCSDSTITVSENGDPPPSLPSDLSLFDPLLMVEPSGPMVSSTWLVSALQSCQPKGNVKRPKSCSPAESANDEIFYSKPFADEEDDNESVYVSVTLPVPSQCISKAAKTSRSDQLSLKPPSTPEKTSNSSKSTPSKTPAKPSFFGSTLSLSHLLNKSPNHNVPQQEKVGTSEYLFHAATLISRARDFEADGGYSEAFNTYKEVVSVLLSGVQEEVDSDQRDSVRRKIGQYLSHAEEIYKRHLEKETVDNLRWAVEGRCSPRAGSFVPIVGHLRGDLCDLGSFKVLGVVGNVLLVLDTTCNATRVIKGFQKSSLNTSRSPNILPQFLPYLVQLYRIYETEDSIFLLLEYGSGGCLWDYVSTYLSRSPASPCVDPALPGIVDDDDNKTSNVYSGQHAEGNQRTLHSPFTRRHSTSTLAENSCKSSGEDSDLGGTSKNGPDNSYVALLTKYASSVIANDRVSLAECTIEPNVSEGSEDEGVFSPPATPSKSGFHDAFSSDVDMESKTDSMDVFSPTADVQDIISCSKALLQTVEDTLRKEEPVSAEPLVTSPSEKYKMESQARKVSSTRQRNERRKESLTSSKTKQAQPMGMTRSQSQGLSQRLSSSLGSLERMQRVRHLSEVFGDLESQRKASSALHLPESCVRIWAAEILVALGQLHALGLIWKDFNPSNILLGERGHVLLSYVCRINCVDHVLSRDARRNLYSAPEVGGIHAVTRSCDLWSLGSVLYELFTGTSLVSCHPTGITSHTQLHLPDHLSLEAKDLLDKLLKYHPSERLGSGSDGIESIQAHPFFSSIDWSRISSR